MKNRQVLVTLQFIMKFCIFMTILGFPKLVNSFWPVPYRIELNDRKTFVITAGEDDDEENEMIRSDDIIDIVDLGKNEERYKPLHSHVEHYNRRAAEAAKKYTVSLPKTQINVKENHFVEEEKPFIAGFKHNLDKLNFSKVIKSKIHVSSKAKTYNGIVDKLSNKKVGKNNKTPIDRSKREEDDEKIIGTSDHDMDRVETMSLGNHSLEEDEHATMYVPDSEILISTTEEWQKEDENTRTAENAETSDDDKNVDTDSTEETGPNIFDDSELATPPSEDEEVSETTYDYESLRAEYEEQLEKAKKSNSTYNITDTEEPEETAKDAIKKMVDFKLPKNCTEEELTKFGAQAFACLAHDYKNAKNHTEVRTIVSKTWGVLKIWICIYICIAVPAWCQKGWCCCCFRCSVCFPHERIAIAKSYYAHNEPGVLIDQPRKKSAIPIRYKPTLFEIDAYEDLEGAIRNL